MGKDHLAARRDAWTTRRLPVRAQLAMPDHPRHGRSMPARVFSFATFRAISPVLVPFMLGSTCFGILLLLSFTDTTLPLAIEAEGLVPIFFVYAATGVILAAALGYAPNDTIWSLAMVTGLILFGAITVWAVFGLLAGIALVVALLLLLSVVVRGQMHTVLEDTVHAMVLFGKHNRVLHPGFNLRLPGEQVWAIVNTAEVTIAMRLQSVALHNGYRIDIAASTACRAIPERAFLTAPHGNEWPEHVRCCLELTLRETLGEMQPDELLLTEAALREPAQGDPLAVRLRGRLQHLVGGWGIQVAWVRPHSWQPIAGMPAARSVTPSGPLHLAARPDVASGPHPVAASPAQSIPVAPSHGNHPASGPFRLPDVAAMRGLSRGALLPLPPAMRSGVPTPEALAEAYAAVRERRISDAGTILRLAESFDTLAGDPVLGPHLPFDAREAARNLRTLVQQMASVR